MAEHGQVPVAELDARDPLALVRAKPDTARSLTWWLDSGEVDPWRAKVEMLSRELSALGIAHQLQRDPLHLLDTNILHPALGTAVFSDAAPLLGTYKGPSRGREMVLEVTQGAEGIEFSVNGSPKRSLPWVDGLTFRQGSALLTFRQTASGAPAAELRFQSGAAYYILKRQ